ncbi:MAG: hypothetical protein AB1714_06940 [Acidobacteriota bacterium]
MVEGPSGSVVLAGTVYTNARSTDGLIMQVSSAGQTLGTAHIGRSDQDNLYQLIRTSDGGYLAAGSMRSVVATGYVHDPWILKLDRQLLVQWQYIYRTAGDAWVAALAQLSDGKYQVVGTRTENGATHSWLLRLDKTGGIRIQKEYACEKMSTLARAAIFPDGGCIYLSTSWPYDDKNHPVAAIRTDAACDVAWAKEYTGGNHCEPEDVFPTASGGFACTGGGGAYTPRKWWFVETDARGAILRQYQYTGEDPLTRPSFCPATDGGWLMGGVYDIVFDGTDNLRLLKIKADGKPDWAKYFVGAAEQPRQMLPMKSGAWTIGTFQASIDGGRAGLYRFSSSLDPCAIYEPQSWTVGTKKLKLKSRAIDVTATDGAFQRLDANGTTSAMTLETEDMCVWNRR